MPAETSFAVPDLSDANILRFVAGLRPCRHGGLRIEAERLGSGGGGGGGKILVHNYGQGGCGVTIGWGCAERAVRLLAESLGADARLPVAVLGGGVVGLTTAYELLTRGHPVTLIAERLAGETTSNIAGALWLPTGIDFPDDPDQRRLLNDTVRRSGDRFRAMDRERWGIEELPVYEPEYAPHFPAYFESGAIEEPTPVPHLPGRPDLPGRVFRTLFIHTPRFLNVLRAEVESLMSRVGGRIVRSRIAGLDGLRSLPEPAIVNCLGLGSRELFGDPAVYPARGLLVHMKPQPLGYIMHDGYRYMFPREDALVLGGCFDPDVWETEPDETICRQILEHHRRFFAAGRA